MVYLQLLQRASTLQQMNFRSSHDEDFWVYREKTTIQRHENWCCELVYKWSNWLQIIQPGNIRKNQFLLLAISPNVGHLICVCVFNCVFCGCSVFAIFFLLHSYFVGLFGSFTPSIPLSAFLLFRVHSRTLIRVVRAHERFLESKSQIC